MRTSKVIKHFLFDESQCRKVTLGSGVRLDSTGLSLVLGNAGYPTATNLYAMTRVANPKTVKRWSGFEVDDKHQKDVDGVAITFASYRLSDGTSQYWWNGSAWVVDSSHWNTESDVAGHISSFSATTQSIQIIINLRTSNPAYTPYVREIKVLYDSDIEWDEEYVARSLVPALREQVRPIADFDVMTTAARAAAFNLNAIETPYNIVGLDSVFDLTADPRAIQELAATYDASTKIVSMATPIPARHRVRIRFTYEPEVAINTGQDFYELAKTPAIVVEEIHTNNARRLSARDSVINRTTGDGWQEGYAIQADLDMMIRFIADKTMDMNRIAGQLKKFFESHLITARGQDEQYPLFLRDPMDHLSTPLQSDLRSARLRAIIRNAIFYVSDAERVYGVRRFLIRTQPFGNIWDSTFDKTFGPEKDTVTIT